MYLTTQTLIRRTLNVMNQNTEDKALHGRRIATGEKIFSPLDDPSGEAMSRKMRYDLMALDEATRNTQKNHSMCRVAHGALESTKNLLTSIKEKAIAAANDNVTYQDRQIIQKEIDAYIDQIDYNTATMYNGKFLIDGSHRRPSDGTIQALTNMKLAEDTEMFTKLTELQAREGGSLEINSTDKINISYVHNARTFSTYYTVGDTTVEDIFRRANSIVILDSESDETANDSSDSENVEIDGTVFDMNQTYTTSYIGVDASGKAVLTSDGRNALTVHTTGIGINKSVSGFTIRIDDALGNIKRTANDKLDSFEESITPIDATANNTLSTQISDKANRKVELDFNDMSSIALGLKGKNNSLNLSVSTQINANAAIKVADTALHRVSEELTKTGAFMARLEYTAQNLTTYTENLTASESTIKDADIAKEMLAYTTANVNIQSAESMLQFLNNNSDWFMNLLA